MSNLSTDPALPPTPVTATPPPSTQTQGTTELGEKVPQGTPAPATRVRPGFAAARLDLTAQEFENPITAKFLYREVERLDEELAGAKPFISRCAEMEKAAAVLGEKLVSRSKEDFEHGKNQTLADVCFGLGIGIGGVMLGLVPSFANATTIKIIFGVIGLLLIVGGVIVKVVKK